MKQTLLKKVCILLLISTTALFAANKNDELIKPVYQNGSSYIYNLERAILKAIDEIQILRNANKNFTSEIKQLRDDVNLSLDQNKKLRIELSKISKVNLNVVNYSGSLTEEERQKIENFVNE